MIKRRGTLTLLTGVICVVAASPTMADINSFVGFTYSNLSLQYDQLAGRTIEIYDTAASRAVVQAMDGGIMQRAIVQSGNNFDFRFSGTVGDAASGYAINGTVTATDVAGTPVFQAAFQSSSVEVASAFQGTLMLSGTLSSITPTSTMLTSTGRGPWMFDAGSGSTVQVQNYQGFNDGQLFNMNFGIDATTLAAVFDAGALGGNLGVMQLTSVSAPVSPALLLGGVGFATIGLLRRRLGLAS